MCAKKTPTTPTKQNALTGVTKSPAKKPTPTSKQTTKNKVDDSIAKPNLSSAIGKDVKASSEAKKTETKATATSNKKVNKVKTKASNPSTPTKGCPKQTTTQSVKDTNKKTISRDSSTDTKSKRQALNGKVNKAKASDGDRDKLSESKSNHIRDNKITIKNDDGKSKSTLANEQCNKFEKSSSSLSLKSSGESDNVAKEKEKLCKKSDKAKQNLSPVLSPKKINNKSAVEGGGKKSADKVKSSKLVKKASKEKESKIKISNELKNLGIDMSKTNTSLAVFDISMAGMTMGMKTSICEMVKTKARFCSNINSCRTLSPPVKKTPSQSGNKTNKESQEKIFKEVEIKAKANNENVESKKANTEINLIEGPKDDEKMMSGNPIVKNKISALVNAKNKIKTTNELKRSEDLKKSNEEASKGAKRKYTAKKKKPEDATDSFKNSNSTAASETDARNNDKIDHNKSSCVNISDCRNVEIKSTSKADARNESKVERAVESAAVGKKDSSVEGLDGKELPSKVKSAAKNQLVKKTLLKVDIPMVAAKIKRKYVRKVKPIEPVVAGGGKPKEKPQSDDDEEPTPIKLERDKSLEAKLLSGNGIIDKKAKNVPVKDDLKKSSADKITNPLTPQKDLSKVTKKVAVVKSSNEKKIVVKGSPKKQKMEIKQERDPLESHSSESEISSASDTDSERDEDTFKKPKKPSIQQRNLRNKMQMQITCKRSRVASLNASAKVHCLYENEHARTAYEATIAKVVKKSCGAGSTDDDEEEIEIDLTSKR